MNALDTALTRLAAASTALEYTAKPGLKDVENAKKEAKAAAEILDAAHRLMGYGVYTVAQEPAAPGVALFDDKGQPAPATQAPEPTALELIAAFPEWDEAEQGDCYQAKLDELATATPDVLEDEPWDNLWEQDRLLAFKSAMFCLAAEPQEFLPPGEAAVAIWLAKLQPELPPLPDLLGDFQAQHPAMRDKRWNEGMDKLFESVDVTDTEWDSPWEHAYTEDPVQAFARLTYALEHRQPASTAYPTDEEMADWTAQFAPAAPQFDAAEFFASKLRELEEAGHSEGSQKLKGWKTAEKAWKAEFKADPEAATNKLLWRLQQVSINWAVPSNEEVA
jgi:hypothetical protein